MIGKVLRHSDGPDYASHGCVEVNQAREVIDHLISERDSAQHLAAEWQAAAEAMREATESLVTQMELVHGNAAYQSVWELWQNHFGYYKGPQYGAEFLKAKSALSLTPADALTAHNQKLIEVGKAVIIDCLDPNSSGVIPKLTGLLSRLTKGTA